MQQIYVLKDDTGYVCNHSVNDTERTNFLTFAWFTSNYEVAKLKAVSLGCRVFNLQPVLMDENLSSLKYPQTLQQ